MSGPENAANQRLPQKPDRLLPGSSQSKWMLEEKRKRNHGLFYYRREIVNKGTGKIVRPAKAVPPKVSVKVHCTCELKCWRKFQSQSLDSLCEQFYETGRIEDRRNFILRYCSQFKRAGFYNKKVIYSLPVKASMINEQQAGSDRVRVCRKFFLAALDVSGLFVYYTLNVKQSSLGTYALPDLRGKASKPTRALSARQFMRVAEHVDKVKKLPSHYGRARSNKIYVPSDCTMGSLFRNYITANSGRVDLVSYSTYRRIVKSFSEFVV